MTNLISDDGTYVCIARNGQPSDKTVEQFSTHPHSKLTRTYQGSRKEFRKKWDQEQKEMLEGIMDSVKLLQERHSRMLSLLGAQARNRKEATSNPGLLYRLQMAKRLYDNTRHEMDVWTVGLEQLMAEHADFMLEMSMKIHREHLMERLKEDLGDEIDTEGAVCIHEVEIDREPRPRYVNLIREADKRLETGRPDADFQKDDVYDYHTEPAHTFSWTEEETESTPQPPYKGIGKRKVRMQPYQRVTWASMVLDEYEMIWLRDVGENVETGYCHVNEWETRDW